LSLKRLRQKHAPHKHRKVKASPVRHPRFTLRFTPAITVEESRRTRLRGLRGDCVREGSLASAVELTRRNEACLAERYLNPKPYRWKAKGREILEKIHRARQALSAA
jgi:hypothetical protein